MLPLCGNVRIFLYQYPTNMHKSFEGLSKAVEETFPGELFKNAYFLFLNRRKDCMKILYWDGDGFIIWYKRLEKGCFKTMNDASSLDRRQFFMLLEGIIPRRLQHRFSL
jgi:transposase